MRKFIEDIQDEELKKMMIGSSTNNNYNYTQKFKGVVPQQNGHWGAQIYANHQRIWLGTFKSEREAAMAYDSATIKLRSGESHRNFPWNDQTVQEPNFQSHYTTEAVLSMIRDGTYPSKFASFLISTKTLTLTLNSEEEGNTRLRNNGEEKFSCTLLFQKELTPSDVGKLNRLVIPKKHASRYFPCVFGNTNIMIEEGDSNYSNNNNVMMDGINVVNGNNNNSSDTELVFYDKLMRSWKFRYCYWRSSQSFVFTRGWNRFVKDKSLRAKDVIAFYKCEPLVNNNTNKKDYDYHHHDHDDNNEVFSLIDVIYNEENVVDVDERNQYFGEIRKRDFNQNSGKMLSFNINDDDNDDDHDTKDQMEIVNSSTHGAEKGLRLFGVRIN